jgi:hypothetical protein
LKLIALPLPPMWTAWLWVAEFALPFAIFAWSAYHMMARNRRWHAALLALLTPTMLKLALLWIQMLSKDGT